ncbi:MAG: hypothetical protein L0H63_00430 [Nitrococcus sp.]|nr:hypothetical protein [Nitrococcus sp.]
MMIAMFSGVLAVAIPGSAGAMHTPSFNGMDQDKDGHISQQEAGAYSMLVEHFSRFDNDINGKLDQAEFSRFETTIIQERSPRLPETDPVTYPD